MAQATEQHPSHLPLQRLLAHQQRLVPLGKRREGLRRLACRQASAGTLTVPIRMMGERTPLVELSSSTLSRGQEGRAWVVMIEAALLMTALLDLSRCLLLWLVELARWMGCRLRLLPPLPLLLLLPPSARTRPDASLQSVCYLIEYWCPLGVDLPSRTRPKGNRIKQRGGQAGEERSDG